MKFGSIIAAFFLVLACLYLPDNADAARMGGGKSFGSRPQMSRPAQTPMQRQQTPGAQAGATAARPGMFGGMGGLFGGLLAGTLLGSLLSGNGMGGGGFMDILLIGILAFLAWKLFSRFRAQRAGASQGPSVFGRNNGAMQPNEPLQRNDTQPSWNNLKNLFPGATPQAAAPTVDIPADFDSEEFLRGAKMAYTRMQKSWDNRDLNDIGQFATASVMRELRAQAAEDPNPSQTEIMMVNAELVGVEPEGDNLRAQVYFDVLMREDPAQPAPENAREIWHFLRIGKNGNWKLDGIQQVE